MAIGDVQFFLFISFKVHHQGNHTCIFAEQEFSALDLVPDAFGKSSPVPIAIPLISLYVIMPREMVVDEHFEDRLKVEYDIE